MRIANWNLQSDKPLNPRRAAILSMIAASKAEVLVLTETWGSFEPGRGYYKLAESSAANELSPTDRRWVACWSCLPGKKIEVLAAGETMACARIEQPNWPALVVVGTVLPRICDGGGEGYLKAIRAQAAEWERLWANQSPCIFCVTGDFNQPLEGVMSGFSWDARNGLEACLKQLHLECLTRSLKGQENHSDRAIDHICRGGVPQSLEVKPAERLIASLLPERVGPVSDHDVYYVDIVPV